MNIKINNWWFGFFVALVLVAIFNSGCATVSGYADRAVDQIQVERVEYNWKKAYRLKNDMEKAAEKVCTARKAYGDAVNQGNQNTIDQRYSQLVAVENMYSNVRNDYDKELENAFELKYTKPDDIYESGWDVDDMIQYLGLSCGDEYGL